MIEINILIADEETNEAYAEVHPDLIESDFRENPRGWLENNAIITVQHKDDPK